MVFLKNYSIFFPSCFFAPYKSFEDIFWEKLEKNKNFKICQKISNNFFSAIFSIFYQKKYISQKLFDIFS